jgi:hypothetical protein
LRLDLADLQTWAFGQDPNVFVFGNAQRASKRKQAVSSVRSFFDPNS